MFSDILLRAVSRHNEKPVDLSRTIRLSGLLNGAKLSLVQSSRSPTVINVALQLPTSGDASGSLARLTEKFPSDTPLWQLLRRFEDGTAGNPSKEKRNYNFTQRATPVTTDGEATGAGRLNYEMPVVNIMGRELATFLDLQKTLGQLGFSSGSCLIRLTYRDSGQPMSEAMDQITTYFKSIEPALASDSTDTHGAHGLDVGEAQSSIDPSGATSLDNVAGERVTADDHTTESTLAEPDVSVPFDSPSAASRDSPMPDFNASSPVSETAPQTDRAPPLSANSSIAIFSPPSTTTSHTATSYSEEDYVPTLDHAQLHQARLASETRNRKLLSDAELATAQKEREAALAKVRDVMVRIRFPDQSLAQRSFGQDATVADVYAVCREVMESQKSAFELRVLAAGIGGKPGGMVPMKEEGPEGFKRLIKDLSWQGRVLATVVWGDSVTKEVREAPSLKKDYRAKAEELKAPILEGQEETKKEAKVSEPKKEDKKGKGVDKESKMRGLLKGLSKK